MSHTVYPVMVRTTPRGHRHEIYLDGKRTRYYVRHWAGRYYLLEIQRGIARFDNPFKTERQAINAGLIRAEQEATP